MTHPWKSWKSALHFPKWTSRWRQRNGQAKALAWWPWAAFISDFPSPDLCKTGSSIFFFPRPEEKPRVSVDWLCSPPFLFALPHLCSNSETRVYQEIGGNNTREAFMSNKPSAEMACLLTNRKQKYCVFISLSQVQPGFCQTLVTPCILFLWFSCGESLGAKFGVKLGRGLGVVDSGGLSRPGCREVMSPCLYHLLWNPSCLDAGRKFISKWPSTTKRLFFFFYKTWEWGWGAPLGPYFIREEETGVPSPSPRTFCPA